MCLHQKKKIVNVILRIILFSNEKFGLKFEPYNIEHRMI